MPLSDAVFAFVTPRSIAPRRWSWPRMGGVLSERAGVVNIALEGLMLTGAFVGVAAGRSLRRWSDCWRPGRGRPAGPAPRLSHAADAHEPCRQRPRHQPAGGGRDPLSRPAASSRTGVQVDGLPQSLFLVAGAAAAVSRRVCCCAGTRFGLRLRAVGESPESARMAGIAAVPSRYVAVTLSGVCAALAGAYLSLADAHTFLQQHVGGQGLHRARRRDFRQMEPARRGGRRALFRLLLRAANATSDQRTCHLTSLGIEWTSPFLLDTLPYLMTLAALVSVVGRAAPPAALGQEEA